MTRSNVVAVISFAVVFAAGFFVGQLGWGAADAGREVAGGAGSLTSQLDLTPPQQELVRKIWNEQLKMTTTGAEKRWEEAEHQRDAELRQLLAPGQLKEYELAEARHQERAKAFRLELFQKHLDAQSTTRQLLSPAQRVRFDKIVAERGAVPAPRTFPCR